ncbi:hypothetical protein ACP4OV_017329 [Aristida adscensionis]
MALPWWRSRWGAKQYVVAGLLGTLVVFAVAAAISIALAPGHVAFSIPSASMQLLPLKSEQSRKGWYYNFTVVANNTSRRRRMAVSYDSLSAQIWSSRTAWIPAEPVPAAAGLLRRWQRPGLPAEFAVSAEGWQFDQGTQVPRQDDPRWNDADCTVVVMAKVRFRLGMARSMAYDVKANCFHVNFLHNIVTHHRYVECKSA